MEQTNNLPAIPQEIAAKLSKNKAVKYNELREHAYTAGVQFYKAINQIETWNLELTEEQLEACKFILKEALEMMPMNYKHAYLLNRIGNIDELKSFDYRTFNFFQEMAGKIEVRGYDNVMKLYRSIHVFEEAMNDIDVIQKQQQTASKVFNTINAEYGKFCNENHIMPEDIEEFANNHIFGK